MVHHFGTIFYTNTYSIDDMQFLYDSQSFDHKQFMMITVLRILTYMYLSLKVFFDFGFNFNPNATGV
jgi:hypothetical protein